jgi:hypothetical protein
MRLVYEVALAQSRGGAAVAAACAQALPAHQQLRLLHSSAGRRSKTIEDLVGPEALEPLQRLVERGELVGIDVAHLLDGADVLLIGCFDVLAYRASLVGELDPHRTAIDATLLMME